MTCEKLYLDSSTNLPSKHFIVKQINANKKALILLMLPKAPLFLLETLGRIFAAEQFLRQGF